MKYLTLKRKSRINTITGILFLLALLLAVGGGELIKYVESNRKPLLIPYSDTGTGNVNDLAVVHVDTRETTSSRQLSDNSTLTVSQIVEKEVKKFAKTSSQESYLLYLTHCLLWKESKHNTDRELGDGGLAGGPTQFHESTYTGYRNLMMKANLADHVGSRFDLEDSINTMLWAVTTGRSKAWGPVNIGYCKTK